MITINIYFNSNISGCNDKVLAYKLIVNSIIFFAAWQYLEGSNSSSNSLYCADCEIQFMPQILYAQQLLHFLKL